MPDPEPPIRVLIVDDHSVVRTGLRVFLDLQPDIEVVGEAADGSEGVAVARRLEPDVVLMDLLMPNMDGITAIGRIKEERPETEIVTMTSFIEEEKVTAALEAGASGYVLKDAEAEEVAAADPRRLCRRGPPRSGRRAPAGPAHAQPQVPRRRARRAADRAREGRPAAAGAGDEQQGDRLRRCSSPSAPPGPTSRTSSASSASRHARRPPSTPSSTSWSTAAPRPTPRWPGRLAATAPSRRRAVELDR